MEKEINNIYAQISYALIKQSKAYIKKDVYSIMKLSKFIHARCLRIEELKNTEHQPSV